MVATVQQGFEQLRRNLEITGLQSSTVSTRQTNVRDAIKKSMTVLDDFLTGSYKRSTMVAPLSEADVDIFIVLDSRYYKIDGQASLLDQVRKVLSESFSRTMRISRNGQAVTIFFNDFQVDVVPGFYRSGGGFLIPDSISSRWVETDPKKHVDIWSNANIAHNGDLVPLIKMIKGWNKQHSTKFQSFHLEALILQILNNVKISDFPSGVRYTFQIARTQYISVYDPAGYGGNLASYLDTQNKRDEVYSRLDAAYTKALEAEQLEQRGLIKLAIEKWQVIFGDYFPSYG